MLGFNFDLSKIGTGQNITQNITPAITTVSKIGTGQNAGRAAADIVKATPSVAATTKKAITSVVSTPSVSSPAPTPNISPTANLIREGSRYAETVINKKPIAGSDTTPPGGSTTPPGGRDDQGLLQLLDYVYQKGLNEGTASQYWYESILGTGGGAVGTTGGYQISGTDPMNLAAAGMANMSGQIGLGLNSFLSGWGDVGTGIGAGLGTGIGAMGMGAGGAWQAVGEGIGGGTRDVTSSIGGNIIPLAIIGGLVLLGGGLIARSAV